MSGSENPKGKLLCLEVRTPKANLRSHFGSRHFQVFVRLSGSVTMPSKGIDYKAGLAIRSRIHKLLPIGGTTVEPLVRARLVFVARQLLKLRTAEEKEACARDEGRFFQIGCH